MDDQHVFGFERGLPRHRRTAALGAFLPSKGFVRVTAGRLRMAQPRPKRPLGREVAPLGQRAGSSLFVNFAGDEMALLIEMVVDLSMN